MRVIRHRAQDVEIGVSIVAGTGGMLAQKVEGPLRCEIQECA